ncbi:hypothetical protein EG68_04702 [Paragonimus skrjabini miyazakii]|uniref:Secreted protein n=1 Tax=Paragonimus skrjabini miyazakii TaxID=59628 RepID=A0A8S9YRD6_9TREM|nr:hypothetical protein EG68_07692 [Paragonimus skrjabini miyazakii]KAF7258073.1 hypothetical protein EG68_04702 [Paragonimus skrjabini miyazakii]
MYLQLYSTMLLFATVVGSSDAASHFGNDCNSMIKSLNQKCITDGYEQLGCSSYGGQSNTAAACNRCVGCNSYAKTCLRVNLVSTHAVSQCANAKTMARTLERQGY